MNTIVVMILAASLAVIAQSARSNDTELEKSAAVVSAHAERVFSEIDIAMSSAEEVVRRKNTTTVIKHAAIRTIVDKVNGLRAILAVSNTGTLEVDSFSFPTPVLNLASRPYFQLALSRPGALILTPPEIGKTSGVPFLPMVRGNGDGVIVGVINPGVLTPRQLCANCIAVVVDQAGQPVDVNPPGSPPISVYPDYSLDKSSGEGRLGNYRARYIATKLGKYPFFVLLFVIEQ
jgi:hypothetical protein